MLRDRGLQILDGIRGGVDANARRVRRRGKLLSRNACPHRVFGGPARMSGEVGGFQRIGDADAAILRVASHHGGRNRQDQRSRCLRTRGIRRGALKRAVDFDRGRLRQRLPPCRLFRHRERKDGVVAFLVNGEIGDGLRNGCFARHWLARRSAPARAHRGHNRKQKDERQQGGGAPFANPRPARAIGRFLGHRGSAGALHDSGLLQDVAAQVLVLHDCRELLLNVGGVELTLFFFISGASNEISSSTFSRIVCRRRAPMFSVCSLTIAANRARDATASSVNESFRPSVSSSATYCLISAFFGSVRMRTKSASERELSSTRIGKRPCSSGIRSEGLVVWNAPAAMKRMCSVRTIPYRVFTVVPSTIGRMSRCTPSRDTSGPWPDSRPAILSTSSIKRIPICSTRSTAIRVTWSMSINRLSSSWIR